MEIVDNILFWINDEMENVKEHLKDERNSVIYEAYYKGFETALKFIKEKIIKIKNEENGIIELKDKEINDIKMSLAEVLLKIRTINESNEYSAPEVKRRKISELCTNTRYELLIDEIDILKNRTTITKQSNK